MDEEVQQPDDMNLKEAISLGADFGLKTGCFLSIIYTFIGTTVWLIVSGLLNGDPGFYLLSLYIAYLILFFLAAPLLLLAAVTGATISAIVHKNLSRLNAKKAFIGGIAIGILLLGVLTAIIALIVILAPSEEIETNGSPQDYFSGELLTPLEEFWFLYLIPISLYMLTCGWVSRRFFVKFSHINHPSENPVSPC